MIFEGAAEVFGCPVFLKFNVFPDFERSTGNSNVRDSGRTFEILTERSNFWPSVWKMTSKKMSASPKNGLPEFFVEATTIF